MPDGQRSAAPEREPSQPLPSGGAAVALAPTAVLASTIGNQAMARLARRLAAEPRARAAALTPSGLRTLARAGPDAGVPSAPPPDRDTLVHDAITRVLSDFQGLTITVPAAMPPAPGKHPHPGPPAPAGGALPAAPAAPTTLTFAADYHMDGSKGSGHDLSAAGVAAWFNRLPHVVRIGKGTPAQLTDAMQQAVDRGLLNGTWPPTATSARDFMKTVGLGVDCSGFVYQALMAADAALTGAGMTGLTTPQTLGITDAGSQEIGADGKAPIKSPGDLQVGDIIQQAPHGAYTSGHIRILTAVRRGKDYVEYDADESTTRLSKTGGPLTSTWRLPSAGPMDISHLEVKDAAGAWGPEPSGRPTSYWRRLAVPPKPTPATAPTLSPKLARKVVPPRAGGWNEGDRDVTGTWRFRATGLSQGLDKDSPDGATTEDARHLAVAIVPHSVTNTNLEVLLHFHGNNIGQRERTSASDTGQAAGTVHDVEADLIPQQLANSTKHNMIAILPQGATGSGLLATKFAIKDPQAYVNEVLGQVVTHVNALDPTRKLQALTPVRIVVSGHSGGGPATAAAADLLQAGAKASDDEWVASPPVLLFDAINGSNELKTIGNMMVRWLNEDERRLTAHTEADAKALLARRGLKLRSTYTTGVYHACNSAKGSRTYVDRGIEYTIPAESSLEARRDDWFDTHGRELDKLNLRPLLKSQYVIEHVEGAHDFTVGTGRLESGPRAAVPGVTQAPHAPDASIQAPTVEGGNLQTAIGKLSAADTLRGTASP
jgi:hypothetical protein